MVLEQMKNQQKCQAGMWHEETVPRKDQGHHGAYNGRVETRRGQALEEAFHLIQSGTSSALNGEWDKRGGGRVNMVLEVETNDWGDGQRLDRAENVEEAAELEGTRMCL